MKTVANRMTQSDKTTKCLIMAALALENSVLMYLHHTFEYILNVCYACSDAKHMIAPTKIKYL